MRFQPVSAPRTGPAAVRLSAGVLTPVQEAFVTSAQPWAAAWGAPGTGKTTAVIAKALYEIEAGNTALVLTRNRLAADAVHTALSEELGDLTPARTAHTVSSLAFALLSYEAKNGLLGAVTAAPKMVTGAETDALIGQIIQHFSSPGRPTSAAERAPGESGGSSAQQPVTYTPASPTSAAFESALREAGLPAEVMQLSQFRSELRDALMRAEEAGRSWEEISALSTEYGIAAWQLIAQVLKQYEEVLALAAGTEDQSERLDVSAMVYAAAARIPQWPGAASHLPDCLIIDDVQEITAAGWGLLDSLSSCGVRIALVGNPDQAVETFRGAAGREMADFDDPLVFDVDFTHDPAITGLLTRLAEHIGAFGAIVHRHPDAEREAGNDAVAAHLVTSSAREQYHAVNLVRSWVLTGRAEHALAGDAPHEASATATGAHLEYRDIAIITRSSSLAAGMANALQDADIPVVTTQTGVLLKAEPAVIPLLKAARISISREAIIRDHLAPVIVGDADDQSGQYTPQTVEYLTDLRRGLEQLLASPYARADSVTLRRIQRYFGQETDTCGHIPAWLRTTVRLIEGCINPAVAATLPPELRDPVLRVATMVEQGSAVADQPAHNVLWSIWQAAGVATPWQEAALLPGRQGEIANRNLDAVMALFEAAGVHAERNYGATADVFLDWVDEQTVASDSLAERGRQPNAVSVLTVAQAAGRHWPAVIIPGIQDGSWPDLRIRDSILQWQLLADVLAGRPVLSGKEAYRAALAQTRSDEMRMLLAAVGCATRHLVMTAVDDGETLPSPFFTLLGLELNPVRGRRILTERGMIARMRAALEAGVLTRPEEQRLAALLADYAAAGCTEADPRRWAGAWDVTTTAPLLTEDQTLNVSASQVENALKCPLQVFLTRAGADTDDTAHRDDGTIVHAIAERFAMRALELPEAEREEQLRTEMLTALEEMMQDYELPRNATFEMTLRQRKLRHHIEALASYLAQHPVPAQVEKWVQIHHDGVTVRGRVDRYEDTPDGTVIVDFKTGKACTKREAAENPQLALYQHITRHQRGGDDGGVGVAGARLVFVQKSGEPKSLPQPQIPPEDDPVPGYLTQMRAAYQGNTVAASIDEGMCKNCIVKSSCPLYEEGMRCV